MRFPWSNNCRWRFTTSKPGAPHAARAATCAWAALLSGVFILASACATYLPKNNEVAGGATYLEEMAYWTEGFRRHYRVHFPIGYTQDTLYPLVIVVHGAFDTDEGMAAFSGFSKLADSEGFIVMYPNGIGILGYLQHWNAGHCCGKAADDEIDDVGFITAAVEDLCARFNIDRKRIYMTGFSNGGMFTYRFGAERSGLLAAIAPLAATIGGRASPDKPEWRPPRPEFPLPVLVMHGLADDDVPFNGGVSPYRGGVRTYLSVPESVRFWRDRNACAGDPVSETLFDGAVHKITWPGCPRNAPVVLYTIKDWGHYWPGPYFTRNLDANHPLKHFDAAKIIWHFFKQHPKAR